MNVDDDGIKMFGLILVVAIVLILLSSCMFQNTNSYCPEGAYECSESPCGCCITDDSGNVDYCSACDGYSLNDEGLCCSSEFDCKPSGCQNPYFCDVYDCCPGSSCETQIGILKPICKPCSADSLCDPNVEDSCCKGMRCSLQGKCENCVGLPCTNETVATDCCKGSECTNNKCVSCERPCSNENDCCSGWLCSSGTCENCNRACDPLNPCCQGDSCNLDNGKCEGCSEGALCSIDKPCCSSYSCNLESGKCEPCEGKPCNTNEDCCSNGICNPLTKLCQTNCKNSPCTQPLGEKCQKCYDGICNDCEDNSICVKSGFNQICKPQGNCAPGTYDCSDTHINCNCCNPDGTCADAKKQVECSTIDGCSSCSCVSYDVIVCPTETFTLYCHNKGCFDVAISDPVFIDQVCHDCSMSAQGCCSYFVPEDALSTHNIIKVPSTECLSNYKYNGKCILRVSYSNDIEAGNYVYSFLLYGQTSIEAISKIGPSEFVISSVRIGNENTCNNIDITRFTNPKYFTVG